MVTSYLGRKPLLGTQVNWAHPLSRGLVGLWLMNEDAGNKIFDISGFGNHGTLVGSLKWKPGVNGYVLDFDGTDHADMGDVLDMGTSDITVCMWINVLNNNGLDIFMTKGGFTPAVGYSISIRSNGVLRADITDSGGTVLTTNDGAAIDDGIWHFVVVTWDRDGNLTRNVDGAVYGSVDDISARTASLDNADSFNISRSTNAFLGSIAQVRVYKDRLLTIPEIRELLIDPYADMVRRSIFAPAAVGVNPKGVLGMPLSRPLAGVFGGM